MAKKKRKRKPAKKPQFQKPISGKAFKEQVKKHYNRILEICDAFGAREVMEQLPYTEVIRLYIGRFRPIKLNLAEGLQLGRGMVQFLRKGIDEAFLAPRTFTFPGGYKTEIPYADYFTYVLTIKFWFRTLEDRDIKNKDLLERKLQPLLDLSKMEDNPECVLYEYLKVFGSSLSVHPDKFLYYFSNDTVHKSFPNFYIAIHVEAKIACIDKRKFSFDGQTREAYLVGKWIDGGVAKLQVNAEDISPNTMMRGMKLDVYIQKHALNRLKQRLDLFKITSIYFYMGISMEDCEAINDGPNRALVGYYFAGHLLGYLVVEICDGAAVIRTFLFLTNDGTPQGKMLYRKLGIKKLDKAYIGLDKLSTFIDEDFKNDEDLKALLNESDCNILLNLRPVLHGLINESGVEVDVEKIKNYLKLNEPEK